MESFVLLSRCILESQVFANERLLKVWIWCLCKASFKERYLSVKVGKGFTEVKINRGEFLFGRNMAEKALSIDNSTVYRLIKKLEKLEMISVKSNNQYSIISICNYDSYQDAGSYKRTSNEQATNRERTSNEQGANTNNNVEESKKETNIPFGDFWEAYGKKEGDKKKCETKWGNLSNGDRQKIMDGLKSFLGYATRNGREYLPYPYTFLNQERWKNEGYGEKAKTNSLDNTPGAMKSGPYAGMVF